MDLTFRWGRSNTPQRTSRQLANLIGGRLSG
jgi:hypothetical protein